MKLFSKRFLQPIFGLLFGLTLGLLVTAFAGENPFHVLYILIKSSVGSPYDLGMTLFYATPLIFTGLSVCVAFHAGMFNIGAEGQLTLGALAATYVGVKFPDLSFPFAPIFATFVAIFVGGVWGFIPGWLKSKFGSHEVINTIMMNFIAAGIASWVVLYQIPNHATQNPESLPVGKGYVTVSHDFFSKMFPDTPASSAFLLAIFTAVGLWFLLNKTVWGYELQVVGQNERAAKMAGISVKKYQMQSMFVAGGLAALVATSEITGSAGAFHLGFSPDYGFLGIAVALLARNHPVGVIFSALLFGALHKGTADLDFETHSVTRDLSLIMQALIILFVCAEGFWKTIFDKRRIHV